MKKVTLKFPDLYLMWAFAKTLKNAELEINTGNKTLVCHCDTDNITDAIINYKAKLVSSEENK